MPAIKRRLLFLLFVLMLEPCTTNEQDLKFSTDFPTCYDFSNESGGKVMCKADGQPKPNITWLLIDGSPVNNVPKLRQIMSDGSLVFAPFTAEAFRQDVHGVSYRCAATNVYGTIVSPQVKVKGVVNQPFDINVYDVYTIRGNTAVMRCHIPKFLLRYVNVTGWIKDSVVSITPASTNTNSKYAVFPTGELLIKDVDSGDAHTSYRCQAHYRLTGETKTSVSPGRLIVTESQGKVPSKIVFNLPDISIKKSDTAFIPCVASGNPPPEYKWTKQTHSGGYEDVVTDGRIRIASGSLIIKNIQPNDSGYYMCSAINDVKMDKVTTYVSVIEPLHVKIKPQSASVDANQDIMLKCIIDGMPIDTITWMKNGRYLSKSDILQSQNDTVHILKMSSHNAGVYQCFAENEFYSAYGSALIMLGDSMPELTAIFGEKVLQPGETLTLECSAKGNPSPQLQWSLDNTILSTNSRVRISMKTTQDNEVSSSLTILNIQVDDGGIYRCIAKTNKGTVVHLAKISIFGKLGIRKNVKYQAVDDGTIQLDCPVYGYPIPQIQWFKNGRLLPFHMRHANHENGSLIIHNIQRESDSGKYICTALGNNQDIVKADVELIVMVPPKISPFTFQDELIREGARARVQCVVREGDSPLKIIWLKDGLTVPQNQGITTFDIDEFSSILMISSINPRHNGNYTCVATNAAGSVQHTASLFVNVPPKVVPFTFQDESLSEGMLVRVSCVVSRGDLPLKISWLKDGQVIPSHLSLSIREFDEYSSVLSIDPLKYEHNGNYTCIARNHAGMSSHTARLNIQVPLRWVTEPEDLNIKSGKDLVITCKAKGYPTPYIVWKKTNKFNLVGDPELIKEDNRVKTFENGTLLVKSVQRQDEGLYICIANNDIQRPLSHVVTIKVQAAPEFQKQGYEIFATRGNDVVIPCEATGNWPITYYWTANNQKLDNGNTRYKINDNHDKDTLISLSTLEITWVDRKDSTVFTCTAKNEIGESTTNITLVVQEKPDAPVIKVPIKISNQTVELMWTIDYNGNSEITNYTLQYKRDADRWVDKMGELTVPGSETTAIINKLKPATLYNFRVKAANALGNGSYSNIVQGKTEETVPEGPPENVDVESIDANTLRVTWNPPKKLHWNGAIRGYEIGYKIHDSPDDFTFTSLEVPEDYTEELIYQLSDLHMYTQYDVIVQAYNSKGKGPASDTILVMTSEDVPSSPPEDVRCSSLSSKSIYILWEQPKKELVNGILRGYKILFKPVEEWYDALMQTKISEAPKITVNDLEVNTNYSIQVLAFTKMGDGVKSAPIYCKTHEDVPEPPESIKVLPSSADSVVVAWKPPHRLNGALTKYNVYYKPIEDSDKVDLDAQKTEELQRDATVHQSVTSHQFVELKGLKKNQKYAFWVTATSAIGESSGSSVVAQTVADSVVAAKTASFDTIIKKPWQEDIVLPCAAVGSPSPNRKWTLGNEIIQENKRIRFGSDGSVIINKISSEDSGNYTCTVYNEHGRDQVSYMVSVQVPPSAPIMDIVSKSRTSIKLQWKAGITGAESIRGYLLHYKEGNGVWNTKELRADQVLYMLDNLSCGTTYELYMEAFNNIGTGSPCDIVTISTDGADVRAPTKDQIIREGSTFVTIHLEAWPSTGCPVRSFSAEYKSLPGKEWIVAGSNIKPSQKKLVISGLKPATWYLLRLTVDSNNKPAVTDYRFATHTATGGTLAPETFEESLAPIYIFYMDPVIFIPAVALLIVVIIASIVMCFYFRRRKGSVGTPATSDPTLHMDTWSGHMYTFPRGHFRQSDPHSTVPRRHMDDPSPYATSRVVFHPQQAHQGPAIPKFENESWLQHPSDTAVHESKFVFPTDSNFEDVQHSHEHGDGFSDYDPPPRTHMMRN